LRMRKHSLSRYRVNPTNSQLLGPETSLSTQAEPSTSATTTMETFIALTL
jgi:hypothetical protein